MCVYVCVCDAILLLQLFDLMIMATKYKVFLCKTGHELLMLTLSQLDTIRPLIVGSPAHISMVNKISGSCIKWYHTELSRAQLELVRQTVLNFLQDSHIKVSCLSLSLFLSA